MDRGDTAEVTLAYAPLQRRLDYQEHVSFTVVCLLLTTPFAILGWLVVSSTQEIRGVIFGLWFLIPFGLSTLESLVILVSWALLHRPILEVTDTALIYAPPQLPWRAVTVPWNDVAVIGILRQRSSDGIRYTFVVATHHPDRYVSPEWSRIRSWWNPSLDLVAIAIPTHWLGDPNQVVEDIKESFAPELAQHHVVVKERIE